MVGNQFFDKNDEKIKHFDFYDTSEYIQAPTLFELLDSLNTIAIAEPIIKGANHFYLMKELNDVPLEERNEVVFKKTLQNLRCNKIDFGVINFAGVDGYGECYGPKSKDYINEISKVDEYISNIFDLLEDKSIIIVSADHGMTSVTKRFDLNEFFNKKGFSVKSLDSHRASHIYLPEYNEDLIELIQKTKEIDKVFSKKQSKKINLYHERTGDIAISASRGIEFEKNGLKGSHGGFLDEEMKVPLMIFGKDINLKIPIDSSKSYSITDIAPTVLKLLNIEVNVKIKGKSIIS